MFGEDIRLIVEVWLKNDAEAAPLVEKRLEEKKGKSTLQDCLDFMKEQARSKAVGNCYHPEDVEAAAWILEFYGEEKAEAKLEGGLMYAICMEKAERFKSYGKQRGTVVQTVPATTADLLEVSMDDLM